MHFASWRDLYASDLQGVYAAWIVPACFLVYLLTVSRRRAAPAEARGASFLRRYALFFTLETILDPFASGPLLRFLGASESSGATAVMIFFVLLGDLRFFLLVFFFTSAGRSLFRALAEAAGWTTVVPLVALASRAALGAVVPGLPEQSIWLLYELAFVAMALFVRQRLIPRRAHGEAARVEAFLRATATYVATYYALWALADVLILGFASDLGWALRVVPNQMYYAFFVPFVYARFFSRR